VTIPQPFAVGRFEVTWDEWDACVRGDACDNGPVEKRGEAENWGEGRRLAISASWNDAQAFVNWLNTKVAGSPYRLLSEAECEYAALAGTTGDFSFDGKITPKKANYDDNYSHFGSPTGEYRRRTVPVSAAGFPVNPWGLYHVHGNVWEWVQDC